MTVHEIRIFGAAAREGRIDMRALEVAVRALNDGAEKAARLHAEGRSVARGRAPAWLAGSAACGFVPLHSSDAKSFAFKVEDRPLAETVARFNQLDFADPDRHAKSAIDLYEDALEAALRNDPDSELFDDGMLGAFETFGEIFRWGVERVEVINGRTVAFTPAGLELILAMKKGTPRPQHVRVAGKLEGLRHTKHRFLLEVEDGSTVAGLAESVSPDELASLFGRKVVVEGQAHFHPSGKVQRIEALRVAPATERDLLLFTTPPRPLHSDSASLQIKQTKPADGWLDKVWGKWPGNETDEEIAQIIEEFS